MGLYLHAKFNAFGEKTPWTNYEQIATLNIRVPVKVAVMLSAGLFRCSHVRRCLIKHKQPLVVYCEKTKQNK